ncbi:MAG: NAD-dependent deacetylase [Gemmataceae bacterium]
MSATSLEQIAGWLRESRHAVAFTGAGISTESGIPAFRTPGGVWSKYQPVYYDDFMGSAKARHEYWRQKCEAHGDFARAQPNAGHHILARWEAAGKLQALITQNIDGLHQIAGCKNVYELHGTARAIACQDCGARFDADPLVAQFQETLTVPVCPRCQAGRLKHATISFGQTLPEEVLVAAIEHARTCDLFFALGSSLVVEPAASLPRLARSDLPGRAGRVRRSKARLIIVNRDPTDQDDSADAVLRDGLGETLTAIDALLTASAS